MDNKGMDLSQIQQMLAAARDAAWNGRHDKAIALCTAALSAGDLDPATEVDLLDARAESHIGVGDFPAAAEDVVAMANVAYSEEDPALIVQALNRKTYVQMRQGAVADAVATAATALETARATEDKHLIATSLLRFGEANSRVSNYATTVKTLREADALFSELGDKVGRGRALGYVAGALSRLGDDEANVRRVASEALELGEQAGDLYGVGDVLIASILFEDDRATLLKNYRRARATFEAIGFPERLGAVIGNLGNIYRGLGLYSQSRRHHAESLAITERLNAKLAMGWGYATQAYREIQLGSVDQAVETLGKLEKLLLHVPDPRLHSVYHALLGFAALARQRSEEAISHMYDALHIAQKSKMVPQEIASQTGLGRAYLQAGNAPQALVATTAAIERHRESDFARMDTAIPHQTWWMHYRALLANDRDLAAYEALSQAYKFLLGAIANVRDEGLRRNFLNKNPEHKAILSAWWHYAATQSVPGKNPLAHLQVESDPREPFQRLAESGLRLNTLRTREELHLFLVEEATELSGGERVLLVLEEDGKRRVADHLVPPGEEAGAIVVAQATRLDAARRTRLAQLDPPEDPADVNALSHIVAPLIAQNELLGYLYVDMAALYGVFDETDRDMMGMLANQGAVALQNARWTETLEQRVHDRTVELETINEIGQGLLANLDLEGILDVVGEKVRQRFGAENIIIAFAQPGADTVVAPYIVLGGQRQAPNEVPAEKTLTAQVMARDEPLLISSLAEARPYPYLLPGQLRQAQAGGWSSLGVPLRRGDEIVGALIISDRRDGAFDDSHVRLLTTIAANMGMALEKTRLFEEAQAARRAAEKASRTKSAFLANMSHELRTPLNAIIGFTRIVRRKGEGTLPEKQLANLEKVLTSSDHLLGLINTVLDIAKIEAGRMEVHPRRFDLGPLADQLLATTRPLVNPGVNLESDLPHDLPSLHTDQEKLKQILLNLLSNAAKFTHNGAITLRARTEGNNMLRVDVADTGIGMSPDAVDRIFEEFQQADSSTTRQYGGTGLGLSISQGLARLLGGDLSAVSEEGEGSTFTLTIPIQYGESS